MVLLLSDTACVKIKRLFNFVCCGGRDGSLSWAHSEVVNHRKYLGVLICHTLLATVARSLVRLRWLHLRTACSLLRNQVHFLLSLLVCRSDRLGLDHVTLENLGNTAAWSALIVPDRCVTG